MELHKLESEDQESALRGKASWARSRTVKKDLCRDEAACSEGVRYHRECGRLGKVPSVQTGTGRKSAAAAVEDKLGSP